MRSLPSARTFSGPSNRCTHQVHARKHCRSARQRTVQAAAGFDLSSIPTEYLYGAATVTVAGLAVLAWQASQSTAGGQETQRNESPLNFGGEVPRENAVLVFGATGRTGRMVVKKLLDSGRTVIAAVRGGSKAAEVFSSMSIKEGKQRRSGAVFIIEEGVDITDPASLTEDLFRGVTQVVCNVGPIFQRTSEGRGLAVDGMTSERVDGDGVRNVAAACARFLAPAQRSQQRIVSLSNADDLKEWERLDDVIMGGNSSSRLELVEGGEGVRWTGDLIVEGGGFCGVRRRKQRLDLSDYDGIAMRVKADGQTFKVNIKTTDQSDTPEVTYQALFDTRPSDEGWTTVRIPWHHFVGVKRANYDPNMPPLDPSKISSIALVYSRFQYNELRNPRCKPGSFELLIDGGIDAYTDIRPQVVCVTSAAVERNARIGNDAEARKRDIPIVQLNPGGTLNHKYAGETAIRESGLSYTVIRPTGLIQEGEEGVDESCLLEAEQGDVIAGRVTRDDVASVVAAAIGTPEAANKTFELRRSSAVGAKGQAMDQPRLLRMFLKLIPDEMRTRFGLPPMPAPVPPPAPADDKRRAEILAIPEVQRDLQRERARYAKQDAAAAGTAAENGAAEAKKWIEAWRAKQKQNVAA